MKRFALRTGFGLLVAGTLVTLVGSPIHAADAPATAPATGAAPAAPAKPKNKSVTGTVVSVTGTSLVVSSGKRKKKESTFTVPDTARVVDENKKKIALTDLKAGDNVRVTSNPDGVVVRVAKVKPKA